MVPSPMSNRRPPPIFPFMPPTDRPTIIVSDLHLGAVPERNERAFLDFLAWLPDRSGDLVINGDLFDFWFEYGSVVLRRHFRVLRALAEVVERGVRIRLVGGNHDAWGGSFLRDEIGLQLVDGGLTTEMAGRRAFVAHGDGLGAGEMGHRVLQRLTRNRVSETAFRLLHPALAVRLADRVSSTTAKFGRGPDAAPSGAERLRRFAATLFRDDPELQLVALGHSHLPELAELGPGQYYLNTGDWLHHFSYGVVDHERIRLERWPAAIDEGSA